MSGDERWKRLTDDELAQIDAEVNSLRLPPAEHDGPLPSLESDNPEWVADRWRAFFAGERFRNQRGQARTARGSNAGLRSWLPEAALVDVWFGPRRLLLRVAAAPDGQLITCWNVVELKGPAEARSYYELPLSQAPTRLAVECRCGDVHSVSPLALGRLARSAAQQGRRPRRVSVSDVSSST